MSRIPNYSSTIGYYIIGVAKRSQKRVQFSISIKA
jgi:hypothetical protein